MEFKKKQNKKTQQYDEWWETFAINIIKNEKKNILKEYVLCFQSPSAYDIIRALVTLRVL